MISEMIYRGVVVDAQVCKAGNHNKDEVRVDGNPHLVYRGGKHNGAAQLKQVGRDKEKTELIYRGTSAG